MALGDHGGKQAQAQIGERPDIEIDHPQLLIARQIDGISGEAESGIVDQDVGYEAALFEHYRETRARFRQAEIERKHIDLHLVPGADDALDAVELTFAARNQAERMAATCQQHGEGLADPARGTGDQNSPSHLILLDDIEPCSRRPQKAA